ncbi:Rieske 2Fe-2S domain-containing protein [Mycobacterium intracellulare]|uniref:Rieske 2Fe-2S domain-containing protein n=1 Tax=Mycobacterium intracellulare TaxID=1767 RepID=UPI00044FF07A|nr:Rieske 2Fe-2S domain-containing protein [Mycobacterium intracellulare]ETZ27160.1 rieske domain protein [Mycobacterium intracellulare MIN_052511_1280]ASL11517.1 oxygenase KshA [Mycobacterium intracellulare subsp. chimaera]ASL23467.1 oxygenase KshA [Mycobacterium intracellulare subsp. chimaera]MDM3935136.1 Rieske 2Fe-2S domain-containing protein [Mycobacterium intracellulare subsp. chimaera]ORV22618.1 Rieske (2Fe-2S) protein [Mycobacterium intracellulare subsp. chimaera]
MTSEALSRFPFAAYPTGWFQVAYSRDVADGEVAELHYFGRKMVCYRGQSGAPYVLDAYCPHLGADIGVGGTVDGDCVQCPFHGWKFDGSGTNVEIPYTKQPNRVARLRAWPTVEQAGIIFVWHSPEGTDPEWELPKIPEAHDAAFAFFAPEDARWRFRSHPQEVFENVVDIAHFATVHGVSAFGNLDVERDGHTFRAVAEVNFETPRGPVSGAVDSELFGLGIDVVRHRGLGRSCTLLTVTPIDGEHVDARYTFFVAVDADTGEMTRMGRGFVRDFCKQITQDIPIWESKIYRERPALARGEAAIMEFRSWAKQSYGKADGA